MNTVTQGATGPKMARGVCAADEATMASNSKSPALCALVALLAGAGWSARADAQIDYVATTVAKSASRQGAVLAGKLTWQCSGDRCTVSAPLPSPGVPFCRDLASTVGALRSFGNEKAQLSAAQLAQCNESA